MDFSVKRYNYVLNPDMKRVVGLFFCPENENRIRNLILRVAGLNPRQIEDELNMLFRDFSPRHRNLLAISKKNYRKIERFIPPDLDLDEKQKQLIGACFTNEYAFESAALMNPSMVPATGPLHNQQEFILSLRQVGEGHISSIGFRRGRIEKNGQINLEETSVYAALPEIVEEGNMVRMHFPEDSIISERIIYPVTADECNGMEDARFVQFEDGTYYATYTAYDGHKITVKLLSTRNFLEFTTTPLLGKAVSNKGMALFPEKIKNRYMMISRQDGENLYAMTSDDLTHWDQNVLIELKRAPWEIVQVGNCGSPLKTTEGWLLLTHGVGPMRKYTIGACLLDLNQPEKVIGKLPDPLLMPNEEEREGYVPNVVYSCGAMIHDHNLIIPYAMSDYRSGFASINVDVLLKKMSD